MESWINSHRNAHFNTGSYEYERAQIEHERRQRQKLEKEREYENWGTDNEPESGEESS
jgi:hypothetical protein